MAVILSRRFDMQETKILWTNLISEGSVRFCSKSELLKKKDHIEMAADQVRKEISDICSSGLKALDGLIALKTKGNERKSHYEAINQIAHYWYCIIAGLRLFDLGFSEVILTGGAEDSSSQGDVAGMLNGELKIVGEVYCVSSALWRAKTQKEIAKLQSCDICDKFILFNLEAKPRCQSAARNIAFYGADRESEEIKLLCYTDNQGRDSIPSANLATPLPQ